MTRKLQHSDRRGAASAWPDGYCYTKGGIMLDDLIAADLRPQTLLEGDA